MEIMVYCIRFMEGAIPLPRSFLTNFTWLSFLNFMSEWTLKFCVWKFSRKFFMAGSKPESLCLFPTVLFVSEFSPFLFISVCLLHFPSSYAKIFRPIFISDALQDYCLKFLSLRIYMSANSRSKFIGLKC